MSLTVREILSLPKRVTPPGRKKRKSHAAHRAWDLALEVDLGIVAKMAADDDQLELF